LEMDDNKHRDCDHLVARSFTWLWVGYYVVTSGVACLYLFGRGESAIWPLALAFFIYPMIGIFMGRYYHKHLPSCTTTREEPELHRSRTAGDVMLWVIWLLGPATHGSNPLTKEVSPSR
jgi:hypothetical protein